MSNLLKEWVGTHPPQPFFIQFFSMQYEDVVEFIKFESTRVAQDYNGFICLLFPSYTGLTGKC